jgi:hypothetical protein
MPDWRAFNRETDLPAALLGPVERCEFRRFARIWASVAIKEKAQAVGLRYIGSTIPG